MRKALFLAGTPDVERDIRDVVHFGSTVPFPVFRFSLGYHFG